MYLLAVWAFLFALVVFVWFLLASGRAPRTSRRWVLEVLEIRATPATAYWIGPTDGAAWEEKDHWQWSNATNDFPGNNTNRNDDVVFDDRKQTGGGDSGAGPRWTGTST